MISAGRILGVICCAGALSLLVTGCGGSARRDGSLVSSAGSAGSAGKFGANGGGAGRGGSSARGGAAGEDGHAEAGTPSHAGAAGEPPWIPERPICGGGPAMNGEEFCGGPLTFATVEISDTEGDTVISAGDLLRFRIVTSNETETAPSYPCLGVAVEGEAALLPLHQSGETLENPIFSGLFALVSGESFEYEFYGRLADDLPSGTAVRFLAWAAALNASCDNSEVAFEIVID